MPNPDSQLPKHIEPALGGNRYETPFTGELRMLLTDLLSSTPLYEEEDDDVVAIDNLLDKYLDSIDEFFKIVRDRSITDTDSVFFIRFVKDLFIEDKVEKKVERFRYFLLDGTLENYGLFYSGVEEVRENISTMLVELFTRNDAAFNYFSDFFLGNNPFIEITEVEDCLPTYHLAAIFYEVLLNRSKAKTL